MKTFFVHFVFLLSGLFSFSQVAVEILEEETANHMVFKARNTLDEPVETNSSSQTCANIHNGYKVP